MQRIVKLTSYSVLILMIMISCSLISNHKVAAASVPDQGNLISDPVLLNAASMNVAQIQQFLSSEGGYLATYQSLFDCRAYLPNGTYFLGNASSQAYYAAGAPCGQTVSAATIIYYVAQVYGVNPQAIMATLQKESSLITSGSQNAYLINSAMGYNCPDSSGCSTTSGSNFIYQLDGGAWTLRYRYERLHGNTSYWPAINSSACTYTTRYFSPSLYPNQRVTFYDDSGVNYLTVNMANAATASLYCYTPHAYNNPRGLYGLPQFGTTGQYYSGSYNFYGAFTAWFGSTYANGEILQHSLGTNALTPNTTMHAGDYIVSPDGKFVTTMQYDGNLVTYAGNRAIWNSGTYGYYGNYATFQNDGNFVVYRFDGSYGSWNSQTENTGANSVTLNIDGNLAINAGTTQKWATANRVNNYAVNYIGTQLSSGTTLHAGDYLRSPDGRYSLVMQNDGNLVVYSADSVAIWNAQTANNPGAYATMQNDGNLVVYSTSGKALWYSGTWTAGTSTLKMQNDGNLVVYRSSDGAYTWNSKTQFNNYQVNNYVGTQITSGTTLHAGDYLRSPDWHYTLVMQEDGNFVIYSADRYTPIWNSRTWNNPGAYATMQNDGNLVVYSTSGKALWYSGTWTAGTSTLKMQNDGNLVVYRSSDGAYTWNSLGY